MKRLTSVLAAAMVISPLAAAADGRALYAERGCAACHGPSGDKPLTPTYPKIRGQNKEYLIRQITDIKTGDRDNGASLAMRSLVATLDEAEIVAIAEYLSSQ